MFQYLPGFSLGGGRTGSLWQTADRRKVMVWKLQSSSPVTFSARPSAFWTTGPKTSIFWCTWNIPCCRAVKDRTISCGSHHKKYPIVTIWLGFLKQTSKSILSFTLHCPGEIVPSEGSAQKCANLRKQNLTGRWGQRFCRTHSMSLRLPATHVRKLNRSEGWGTRSTGNPAPVTASSTLLSPKEKGAFQIKHQCDLSSNNQWISCS